MRKASVALDIYGNFTTNKKRSMTHRNDQQQQQEQAQQPSPRILFQSIASMVSVVVRLLLLSLLVSTSVSANTRHEEDDLTGHVASSREEILSTRKLRKKQFGDLLAGYQAQLDSHNSGEQLLNESDYNRVSQKVKAYTHKLKELDLDSDPRVSDHAVVSMMQSTFIVTVLLLFQYLTTFSSLYATTTTVCGSTDCTRSSLE